MAKTSDPKRAFYTSVYLDQEARDGLVKLAEISGTSKSQVISNLIKQTSANDADVRVIEIVSELSRLIGLGS